MPLFQWSFLVILCFISLTHSIPTEFERRNVEGVHRIAKRSVVEQRSVQFRNKRQVSGDQTCIDQKKNVDNIAPGVFQRRVIADETLSDLSVIWLSETGQDLMILSSDDFEEVDIQTKITKHYFKRATVLISHDGGKSVSNQSDIFHDSGIPKRNGVFPNLADHTKVVVVGFRTNGSSALHVTHDGGKTWKTISLDVMVRGEVRFHPAKEQSHRFLFQSDVGEAFVGSCQDVAATKLVDGRVDKFEWSTDTGTPSVFLFTADGGVVRRADVVGSGRPGLIVIMEHALSFGMAGKFVLCTLPASWDSNERILRVSTDLGRRWNDAQLPSLTPDRFFHVVAHDDSVLFLHVDNTAVSVHGSGTLYVSGARGIVFSESLKNHLFADQTTDFYRVESAQGVYITSVINEDATIRSVISFNRGATWQPIQLEKGSACVAPKCSLQVHGVYSQSKQMGFVAIPISREAAPGLLIVHGVESDSLDSGSGDLYISDDGGRTFFKSRTGPYHVAIADRGSVLVAIDETKPLPSEVMISTDYGRCWHGLPLLSDKLEPILFQGLLTEPGANSTDVLVWGFGQEHKMWTVFIMDLKVVLLQQCGPSDFEAVTSECMLGGMVSLQRLKRDAWCFNARSVDTTQKQLQSCPCTKGDFECDYGYTRVTENNEEKCVHYDPKQLEQEVCVDGQWERVVTDGWRKVEGDECADGWQPQVSSILETANKYCKDDVEILDRNKQFMSLNPDVRMPGGVSTENTSSKSTYIVVSIVITAATVVIVALFFVFRRFSLRKRTVVYRYTKLNQSEAAAMLEPEMVVEEDEPAHPRQQNPRVKGRYPMDDESDVELLD